MTPTNEGVKMRPASAQLDCRVGSTFQPANVDAVALVDAMQLFIELAFALVRRQRSEAVAGTGSN